MFKIVYLTTEFAIGPQPSIDDLDTIRAAGFASLLNLRPDDEQGEYLGSQEAKASANAAGLTYAHSPAENHALFETETIDQFEHALMALPSPIFSHCKTGTRTAILWALVAARHRSVEDVITTLRKAGQELEFLEDELRDSAGSARKSPIRMKDDALIKLGQSNLINNKN